MSERPIANCLLLCERVITDSATNNKSLIDVFNTLGGRRFPIRKEKLCVFVSMTNGNGELEAKLRCTNMDDSKVIFEMGGPLHFPDPNVIIDMVFALENFVIDKPGLYSFDFFCQDELLIERRFNVQLILPKGQTPS